MDQILSKAISKWGIEKQILKFVEEMGECIAAVARARLTGNPLVPVDNAKAECALLEEIADVSIMVDQMKIIYGPHLEAARMKKLERLERRLHEEG